jgi:hypothetical protein
MFEPDLNIRAFSCDCSFLYAVPGGYHSTDDAVITWVDDGCLADLCPAHGNSILPSIHDQSRATQPANQLVHTKGSMEALKAAVDGRMLTQALCIQCGRPPSPSISS